MRVAIADDTPIFRQGVAALLTAVGVDLVAQARDGDELLAVIGDDPPDVAVVDIRMPPTFTDEGLRTAERLSARHPSMGILVLSAYGETTYAIRLLRCRQAGIGYLLKDHVADVDTLLDALLRVGAGESVVDDSIVTRLVAHRQRSTVLDALTERERGVLELMGQGRSNGAIANEFRLSLRTVETHVARVFTKLGLAADPDDNRRVLAVLTWLRTLSDIG
jgi:DNA-binding NarL/FixJ family response regulator